MKRADVSEMDETRCKYKYKQLSCQPRVTVMSCFVCILIGDLSLIDHLCINPIRRIAIIQH